MPDYSDAKEVVSSEAVANVGDFIATPTAIGYHLVEITAGRDVPHGGFSSLAEVQRAILALGRQRVVLDREGNVKRPDEAGAK